MIYGKFSTFDHKFLWMDVNKADLLRSIQNFVGAENELALKEAKHQISIFKALFDQEVEAYEKLDEKEDATHPKEEETNAAILVIGSLIPRLLATGLFIFFFTLSS